MNPDDLVTNPPQPLSVVGLRCARFEEKWSAGSPILLETILGEVAAEVRPELFRELLRVEQEHRRRDGRPLGSEEAWRRFGGLGSWVPEVLIAAGFEEPADRIVLNVTEGPHAGHSFRCDRHQFFLVGRGPGVTLELPDDKYLSRLHFVVEFNPPHARIVDRGSKNKTYLNGIQIQQADLKDGDQIKAGETVLNVSLLTPVGTATDLGPLTMPPHPSVPGYTIERELGRGAMGVVFQATRQSDGRKVAIKMVLPAVQPTSVVLGRFQREVDILAELSHVNIVQFLASGEVNGMLYFAMEYVEGTSLSARVKAQGPLPPETVVALGCQMLDALAYAHQKGFVHRDVKPANLLLHQQGGVEVLKVADFGLARAYQSSAMSGLTMANAAGGTAHFMPPEQVEDFRSVKPAADQYAAGATLYYLLTCQHVYEPSLSLMDLFQRILTSDPIPLRDKEVGQPLPGRLASVIRRSLARRPEQRYPDLRAMREELARSL